MDIVKAGKKSRMEQSCEVSTGLRFTVDHSKVHSWLVYMNRRGSEERASQTDITPWLTYPMSNNSCGGGAQLGVIRVA